MNRWIHSEKGFIGSFDLPWSEWSLISDPDPDHPRGTHPRIHQFIWSTMIQVISDHWSWSGSSQRDAPYNHGQKSWDTFAFLGRFPIHTGPTPPLTQQTMLDACIQNFFQVSILYRVGGGRTARKFSKRMHCFKREARNDRKIWILQYCPKYFCTGLSESWFWGKSLLSSFFLNCFLDILESSRWSHTIIMTFETISST